MKLLNPRFGVAMLLLGAWSLLSLPAVTVYPVGDGETKVMGATGSDDPTNGNATLIDLQSGGTLKINKATSGDGNANLWYSVVCTNGPAQIELQDGITCLSIHYNFIVRAPGALVVKTKDCRRFHLGHNFNSTSPAYNWAQYDLAGWTDVQDENGTSVVADSTFYFNYSATLLSLPPSQFALTCKPGTCLGLARARMFSGDTIALGAAPKLAATLILLNPEAIGPDQTVSLESWRKVGFKPCTVPDFATEQTLTWNSQRDAVYDFSIVAANSNATVCSTSWYSLEFRGKISGPALIQADRPLDNTPTMTFFCTGDLSAWTGSAYVSKPEALCLNASHVATASLYHDAALSFVSPAEGGPSAVSIDSLWSMQFGTTTATLSAAAGQTITVGSVSAQLDLKGDVTTDTDVIDILSVVDDGACLRSDGTATLTFNGASSPSAYLAVPASALADGESIWLLPTADGRVATLPSWAKPTPAESWFLAKGAISVETLPQGYGIKQVDESPAPTIRLKVTEPSVAGVYADSSLALKTARYDWQSKAILWLDPSRDESYVYCRAKDDETSAILMESFEGESCRAFRGLVDSREGVTLRAWQSRSWMFYSTKGYESLASIHPLRATRNAPVEGLAYMTCGAYSTTRRIQFENWTEGMTGPASYTAGFSKVPAKFAVLVFGSHLGGGDGVLGAGNAFKRSGRTLADPMMKTKTDVWVNGERVDPTATTFSGSWDVISLDTSATEGIEFLGASSTTTGGGNYLGEMLFFDVVLSDVERRDVERYLAKKWGLLSKYAGGENVGQAVLSGSGSVQVEADSVAELSGSFSGTLLLAEGADVTLAEGAKPYTVDEVAALNPSFWIDPSLGNDVITFWTGNSWACVDKVFQRNDSAREAIYLTAGGIGRAPTVVSKSSFFGPAYTWIDYAGTNETATSQGNAQRMRSASSPSADLSVGTRMGFIVQDSFRGGGTPFLDNILGGSTIKRRSGNSFVNPIYDAKTTDKLKSGTVYLNGESVSYSNGFTGGPEVFTFTATDTVSIGYFADLANSEDGKRQGEMQSEILLFGDALDDTVRSRVEAYLMKKWFGLTPVGYTDYSSATLDGAGTFTAPSADVAPKLATTFAGTYTIGGVSATYAMMFRGGETPSVDGAIVAPNATLALPAAVTLEVSLTDEVGPGDYVLVEAADLGTSIFTLAGPAATKTGATLVQTATRVLLKVRATGTTVIFR